MTNTDSDKKTTFLIATRSAGKIRELRAIFDEILKASSPDFIGIGKVDVIGLDEAGIAYDPVEDELEVFDTFEANSLAKARYFHRISGLSTFADDSGLAVDCLGGKPGVHSKRWGGSDGDDDAALAQINNNKLITEIGASNAIAPYTAKYVCAAAFVGLGAATGQSGAEPDLIATLEIGETLGEIVLQPEGTAGFGYDPHFLSYDLGKTFGAADLSEKQLVSHRGRAFNGLVCRLVLSNIVR